MLPELQAERQLLAIEAATVPHMEQKGRVSVLGRWQRRSQRERPKSAVEALATLPIPIVKVPKREVKQSGG